MQWFVSSERKINELIVYINDFIGKNSTENIYENLYQLQESGQIKKIHLRVFSSFKVDDSMLSNFKIVESLLYDSFDGFMGNEIIDSISLLTNLKILICYCENPHF